MTGNTALDIFIGLVFVYLLYSLFAAVILEIISTWIKLRGANLYRTISSMLNDPKKPKGWKWGTRLWWFIISIFGGNPSQKKQGLAEQFYEGNGIKYLGGTLWKKSKPSTISAEQFTTGLLELMLRGQAPGASQAEAIKSFLEKAPQVQPNPDGKKGKESKTEDFRKNSSSGFQYLQYLFAQAQGDVEKFKGLIKMWYEEMMQISKEWYKQRVQLWLFFIGLWLAFVFNLNTLYITKVLSLNNEARNQMVQMASAFLENNKYTDTDSIKNMDEKALLAYQREIQKQAEEASAVLSLPKNFPDRIEVLKVLSGPDFLQYRDSLETLAQRTPVISFVHFEQSDMYAVLKQPKELPYLNVGEFVVPGSRERQGNDTVLYSNQYGTFRYRLNKNYGPYLNRLGSIGTTIGNIGEYEPAVAAKGKSLDNPQTLSQKLVYFDKGRYFWRYQFWGFMITALAISLGAPFWYDLLNKLMRLRSVTQPVPVATPATQNQGADKPHNTVG